MNIDISKYEEIYNTYYSKIEKAVTNIDSHPCSDLMDSLIEVEDYLKKITNISSSEWNDSVKETMDSNIQICLDNISATKYSIETNWKNAETLYNDLLEALKSLNTETMGLKTLLSEKPKQSHYMHEEIDQLGNRHVSYPGYHNALDNWEIKCKDKNDVCESYFTSINDKLNELKAINSETLTIASVLGLIGIQPNSNLVNYDFRGNEYLIIKTNGGYNGILSRIGVQKPDKCLQWSYKYANNIYANSESVPTNTTAVGLTSSDPKEILQIAAQEILNGNPSVIQVNGKYKGGTTYSRHFVTIVGIKEDADLSNLKQSDFLILDPAGADIKQLDTDMGGKLVTRSLLSAQNATYHPYPENDYIISVYSDPSMYESSTCKVNKF